MTLSPATPAPTLPMPSWPATLDAQFTSLLPAAESDRVREPVCERGGTAFVASELQDIDLHEQLTPILT